ncbi:putative alpha,alpha-trehalose-phosphate synthase [UDP-forming] 7 [Vitis vinifera]|uniref:Putative alpha,alpha-trehalose-phosphate synthase [UDP-forming] 7 n=1 Tax=Vitis vinifera TaxID=29760 RepID=A0A438HN71_VITVI|nr:putative alpha,alpha-trehalose-phosphate synthase [UDP-forming] 7 [Vitis vinifera]
MLGISFLVAVGCWVWSISQRGLYRVGILWKDCGDQDYACWDSYGRIASVMKLADKEKKVGELKQQFEGKTVLLGVDDMDIFKGINLKLLAMEQLLQQHSKWQGKAVLVQIANPARGKGADLEEIQAEIRKAAEESMKNLGSPDKEQMILNQWAIRVNPWNVEATAEAMNEAISMSQSEQLLRHEKHFRVVALDPNFRKLSMEAIVSAYCRAKSRAILLDYDGTVMPQNSINKAPSQEVISILNTLCWDKKNTVFIVSGRGRDNLSQWFSPCRKLGLAAEHGYFLRWAQDKEWETCGQSSDFGWKQIAEPVMKLYTETTDGAKEMLDHLESVLANEPVAVKSGHFIVEVKPQQRPSCRKIFTTMTENGKQADFLLCIGDDRSDEDMFEIIGSAMSTNILSANTSLFACTVGQKPSKAKYYLDDASEVICMLESLAEASDSGPSSEEETQVSP